MTNNIIVLQLLCCILLWNHSAAGNLVLDINPDTISPGSTPDLTINCSFIYNNQPNISTIISLIISKADSLNNQTGSFTEIVSINTFTPDHVNGQNGTNATASGHMDTNLDAYLSLNWTSPSESESGLYRCLANLLDDSGQPFKISITKHVNVTVVNLFDFVVHTLRSLQISLKLQQQKTAALKADFDAQLKNQTDVIYHLQEQVDERVKRAEDLQTAIYSRSPVYDEHYYLVSGVSVARFDIAEYMCNQTDGYLVEIDDSKEYQFVSAFLNKTETWYVMTGARNDDGVNGTWSFARTSQPVTFFNWHASEPDVLENACLYLSRYSWHWEMCDTSCGAGFLYTFMCEVPSVA